MPKVLVTNNLVLTKKINPSPQTTSTTNTPSSFPSPPTPSAPYESVQNQYGLTVRVRHSEKLRDLPVDSRYIDSSNRSSSIGQVMTNSTEPNSYKQTVYDPSSGFPHSVSKGSVTVNRLTPITEFQNPTRFDSLSTPRFTELHSSTNSQNLKVDTLNRIQQIPKNEKPVSSILAQSISSQPNINTHTQATHQALWSERKVDHLAKNFEKDKKEISTQTSQNFSSTQNGFSSSAQNQQGHSQAINPRTQNANNPNSINTNGADIHKANSNTNKHANKTGSPELFSKLNQFFTKDQRNATPKASKTYSYNSISNKPLINPIESISSDRDTISITQYEIIVEGIGTYKGQIRNKQFNGIGELRNKEGQLIYRGMFVNNEFEGIGILFNLRIKESSTQLINDLDVVRDSWNRYEGQLVRSEYHGVGYLFLSNGDYFFGEFIKGKAEGFGIVYKKDGSQICGMWKYNKLIEKF